jgi:hypothetical protein
VFRRNIAETLKAFARMMNPWICGRPREVLIEGTCDKVSQENYLAIQTLL